MSNIKYYDSIENLLLYNFDQYRKTNDVNWFRLDFDGRQPKEDSKELKDIAKKIIDEYFVRINDREFENKLKKWAKIDNLSLIYNTRVALINRFWHGFGDDMVTRLIFIQDLAKHGYKMPEINTDEGDKEYLIKFRTACEGIKTQIEILNNELKEDGAKETRSLHKQLLIVGNGLGLNYKINPRETTVLEWVEMTELLKEKSNNN